MILCAVPLTYIFYQDPAEPVFMMTACGFRILPLCMPLSVICMHFMGYGQVMDRPAFVHALALLDGVVCVAGFTALPVPFIGVNGVYWANFLNGVVTTLYILGYARVKRRSFPRTMDQLMVIPPDFGTPPEDRLDFSVCSVEDVVTVSGRVQAFCLEKGISQRSSFLAALCMEELAGNVVIHGFPKDTKRHSAPPGTSSTRIF